MSVRNMQLEYRGSYLGVLWTVLSPLLMLGIYTFVFGYVFEGSFESESSLEHALGIFVGLAVHNFVADLLGASPHLITSNANFVKKVVFPLEVLVAARLAPALVTLVVKSALIIAAAVCMGKSLSLHHLSALGMLLLLIPTGFGIAMLFSSVGVFVKDLGNASHFLAMALLFGSAVFYPVSKIPADAWAFLQFNPLVYIIDSIRGVVLWNTPIPVDRFIMPLSAAALVFLAGAYVFQRLRPAFSDVI